MRKMVCDCCGGIVADNGRCQYCGTLYEVTPQWFELEKHIIIARPEVITVQAACTMASEVLLYYGEQKCKEIAERDLAKKLVDHLLKDGLICFEEEIDPARLQTVYRARLKAVQPWKGV